MANARVRGKMTSTPTVTLTMTLGCSAYVAHVAPGAIPSDETSEGTMSKSGPESGFWGIKRASYSERSIRHLG